MNKNNTEHNKFNNVTNAGFSLVELIIVIAIIAVLYAVLAPNMLKYVERSKRTSDVYTARQVADIMERIVTIDNPDSGVGEVSDITTDHWDKSETLQASPTNIVDKAFVELGCVPLSKAFPDYVWTMKYNNKTGEVVSIYLGASAGAETFQLFPNGEDFIAGE